MIICLDQSGWLTNCFIWDFLFFTVFATKNSEDMISSKTLEESSFTRFVISRFWREVIYFMELLSLYELRIKTIIELSELLQDAPQHLWKVKELIVGKEISIKSFNAPRNPDLDSIIFEITFPFTLRSSLGTDQIWDAASLFLNHDAPTPNWSGHMRDISTGPHLPKLKWYYQS